MSNRTRLDKSIEYCNQRFATKLSLSSYRPGTKKLYQIWFDENNGKPLHGNHEPLNIVIAYLDGYIKALEQSYPRGRAFL